MRVLCACECSQNLTSALIGFGVDAYSCDLSPCFGNYPYRHFQSDVFEVVKDLHPGKIIAFPPCTHLSFANGAHLKEKLSDGRSFSALDFVKRLWSLPQLVAFENPLGIIPKYLGLNFSQIVSPDDFGSDKKKRTCLWLRGLPLLLPTSCRAGKSFIQSLGSYDFRRSVLDPFLAFAMASQWHPYLL